MTFLPIVERELRVASRRRLTYWIRPLAALVAVAVCALFILISLAARNPGNLGGTLFTLVAIYAFGICLLAGAFVTADSICAEVREGTIGFLFLTDLRGYDVVLGKFTGKSLNGFYALISIIPALALPTTMGGVTGQQFWHMVLALVNSLFISSTIGIAVSVHSRDSQRALVRSILIVCLLTLLSGFTLLAKRLAWGGATLNAVAMISPAQSFVLALTGVNKDYWRALLISHSFGWVLLFWASIAVRRVWRNEAAGQWRESLVRPFFTSAVRRAPSKSVGVNDHAIVWLAERSGRSWRFVIWSVAVIVSLIWFLTYIFGDRQAPMAMLAAVISWPFTLLLKILVAAHACRLFADSRRTGTLELIFTTPLSNQEILRGHWTHLRRIFLWPLVLILCCQIVSIGVGMKLAWSQLNPGDALGHSLFSGFFLLAGVKLVADLLAVACLGTYLSLTMKKPGSALGLTILLVVIIPSLVPCFFGGVMFIALDILFIVWPLSMLRRDLRGMVLRQFTGGARRMSSAQRPK